MTVEPSIEMDDLFTALAHPWRRYTLSFLLNDRRQATLTQLAKNIDKIESGHIDIKRIESGLHHTHLPKLVAVGLVSYDTTTNHVEAEAKLEPGGLLEETLSLDSSVEKDL